MSKTRYLKTHYTLHCKSCNGLYASNVYKYILAEIINSTARSRLCLYHTKCKIESRNISKLLLGLRICICIKCSGEFEHIVFPVFVVHNSSIRYNTQT